MPTIASDTLKPQDITITSPNGANVSSLSVFTATGVFPDPKGVPAGTKCFSWTSTLPGTRQRRPA